ncbi:MAG: DUF2061 domain-containing protein, partial [Halobacteriales archaeon]
YGRAMVPGRSLLVKTVGYRILSVVVTVVVAFLILQDTGAALDIGIIANVAKMGVYYGYERLWTEMDRATISRTLKQVSTTLSSL